MSKPPLAQEPQHVGRHPPVQSRAAKALLVVVVLFYVLVPLVMEFTSYSFLGYRAAPNEVFRSNKHDVVETRRICRADDCDNVPDAWRDRSTNHVFRRADFYEHRRTEARRLGWSWFAYVLLGCLGAALYLRRVDHPRLWPTLVGAICAACAIALMIYFEISG